MAVEYIEVVKRFPIYASIPEEERGTLEFLRHRHRLQPWNSPDKADAHALREWQEYMARRCIVATRTSQYGKWWWPCGGDVAEGADRCVAHGGPSAQKPPGRRTVHALEAEVERLRALLAEKG